MEKIQKGKKVMFISEEREKSEYEAPTVSVVDASVDVVTASNKWSGEWDFEF